VIHQPSIVDRLITYWSSPRESAEEADPLCRELTRELAGVLPRSILALVQAEPQCHREAIEEIVLHQLGLDAASASASAPATPTASRDLGGSSPAAALAKPAAHRPEPVPHREPPAYRSPSFDEPAPAPTRPERAGAQQTVSGHGNTSFLTGDISGGFNFSPQAGQGSLKGASTPRIDDLPDPDSPIRILFLGANPAGSSPLRLDEEMREIDRALSSAALGHRFELHQKWAVRASELQSHLLRCKPQIVHFSGHGTGEMGILLEGEDGLSRPVAGPRLAKLLGQFNQNLRCVVLNACYSEEQAHSIAQEIDCVVGMSTAVLDRVAIRFAATFYESLASGYDVRAAFEQGKANLDVGELGQDAVPQLIVRRRAAETIRFAPPGRR
jgi:hypothetical protein